MRLPEIRDRLHVLADDLAAAGLTDKAATLRTLADETKRRRAVRRTRAKAHPVTDQTRDRIHALARANPTGPCSKSARRAASIKAASLRFWQAFDASRITPRKPLQRRAFAASKGPKSACRITPNPEDQR